MIRAEFELLLNDFATMKIMDEIDQENDANDDDDSRLDHIAHNLRNCGLGFWVYRGGNHVALHFQKENGPCKERAVLITKSL